MTYVKYIAGLMVGVALFAFGIYFHATLPNEPTIREPASIASAQGARSGKYDQKTTEAFRTCIDSRVKNNSVSIGKVMVEGRRWAIVSIPCQGDAAKVLYNAIQPYSSEEYVRYHDKRRGVVRFFGRLFPPSQCVQMIGSGKGKELSDYSCSIRIDVDSEITEQLKL